MGRRLALVIGNSIYNHSAFPPLLKAAADAHAMTRVLGDQNIGEFKATKLINESVGILRQEIASFFQGGKRDDFLLLYFSGHGDAWNKLQLLYLIGKDSRPELLSATALSSTFLKEVMDLSSSRTQVLLLDCCHSGAFMGPKGTPQTSEETARLFEGNGRAVITASSATQQAWEGKPDEPLSLFTHYLVEGLETGHADQQQSGIITLDQWYEYAYKNVRKETSEQTPGKQIDSQYGSLAIARNPRVVTPILGTGDLKEERIQLLQETVSVSLPEIPQKRRDFPSKKKMSWANKSWLWGILMLVVTIVAALVGNAIWLTRTPTPTRPTSPAGIINDFVIPTPKTQPNAIAASPDGSVWFTELDGNKIGHLTRVKRIDEFHIPTKNSLPQEITAGPDGNLWFTEANGKIGRITAKGQISEFVIPTLAIFPAGITKGPDGNLWFTESVGNKIGRITPNGNIAEFSIPTPQSGPFEITMGPDGNLWFAEEAANKIGSITPSGHVTEFTIPTPQSHSFAITMGPDGNIWFTEYDGNQIGRITPSGNITEFPIPTFQSNPSGIAVGGDGNLWFTEYDGNKIGRITTTGHIMAEFSIPTAQSKPDGIVEGPDGNLWFTEANGNKIGFITSGATSAVKPIFPL